MLKNNDEWDNASEHTEWEGFCSWPKDLQHAWNQSSYQMQVQKLQQQRSKCPKDS